MIPVPPNPVSPADAPERLIGLRDLMATRRTVRDFAPEPVPPPELIDHAIEMAGTAPSGAHRQPWRFIVVDDPDTKAAIRFSAEVEEREFYERKAPDEWKQALEPLGTDWHKPHLTDAPYLIVVMEVREPKPYYLKESVGIAVGFLLTALHHAGLATLTHTPNPMAFVRDILGRPSYERPFVIIPVGYPAADATVPDLVRKPLDEIRVWHRPEPA